MGTFRPGTALTFDDVLLVPRHSSVHPRNVDVRSRISCAPTVADGGRLGGPTTTRDLQCEREPDRPIRAAMTKERLVTAPVGTTLDEAERILAKHRIEKLPVVDEQGILKGLITI